MRTLVGTVGLLVSAVGEGERRHDWAPARSFLQILGARLSFKFHLAGLAGTQEKHHVHR